MQSQVYPVETEVVAAVVSGDNDSGVSWAAIAAGAAAACALTLFLTALGAGLGLSTISPWSGEGVSASTFKISAGIYLCVVAVMASAVGGYLAARLRTRLTGFHTNEVFFRDTAHGFIAWAFATIVSAAVLGAASTFVVGSAAQGTAPAAAEAAGATDPSAIYVDRLMRANVAPADQIPDGVDANDETARAEMGRMLAASLSAGGWRPEDRTYAARLIAARSGISEADAEKRIDDVTAQAKAAADAARSAAAQFSLWMAAALLLGAFAASLAAVEGGQLRDGTWNDRELKPRSL